MMGILTVQNRCKPQIQNKGFKMFKKIQENAKKIGAVAIVTGSSLMADPIAAPDMSDVTTSVTAVFGAVLTVAVLIFGFKKIKSLL